jgi:hypothetical protein
MIHGRENAPGRSSRVDLRVIERIAGEVLLRGADEVLRCRQCRRSERVDRMICPEQAHLFVVHDAEAAALRTG